MSIAPAAILAAFLCQFQGNTDIEPAVVVNVLAVSKP
jgi:hypothetical protein